MPALALTGTGLYTPEQSISNEELVASFNEYVRRHNAAHAVAIAEGDVAPLAESSDRIRRSRRPASRTVT